MAGTHGTPGKGGKGGKGGLAYTWLVGCHRVSCVRAYYTKAGTDWLPVQMY